GGAEVLEDVDPVVPAQLGVVDLEAIAVDLHEQLAAGYRVHFDAHAGLVVADDVDVPADEAHLEAADVLDVDRLGAVQQPLLLSHLGSLPTARIRAISRYSASVEKSRYIACHVCATPAPGSRHPHVENAGDAGRVAGLTPALSASGQQFSCIFDIGRG